MHAGRIHLCFAPYLTLTGNQGVELWHFSLKGGTLSHAILHTTLLYSLPLSLMEKVMTTDLKHICKISGHDHYFYPADVHVPSIFQLTGQYQYMYLGMSAGFLRDSKCKSAGNSTHRWKKHMQHITHCKQSVYMQSNQSLTDKCTTFFLSHSSTWLNLLLSPSDRRNTQNLG